MLPERQQADGLAPPPNRELRALMALWMDGLVENGTYSSAEMAALRDSNGVRSWAPLPLHGPRTTLAFADKHVIGGVELWQRKEPTGCFLDNLIRDRMSRALMTIRHRAAIMPLKRYADTGALTASAI